MYTDRRALMGRTTAAMQRFIATLVRDHPGTENSGTYARKRGYHSSRADNQASWPGDYSIRYPPDQWGPSDTAGAADWTFHDAQGGNYSSIAAYSSRLLAARYDPRCTGWREFYGQADTDTAVEGWDWYLDQAVTSDSSHLWHIHVSEHRCWAESWYNKAALLSVLQGETFETFRARGWPAWSDVVEPVRQGLRGMVVWQVQRIAGAVTDGDFGPVTATAVRTWQTGHGLDPDGVVGPATWAVMGTGQPVFNETAEGDTMALTPDERAILDSLSRRIGNIDAQVSALIENRLTAPGIVGTDGVTFTVSNTLAAHVQMIRQLLETAGGDPTLAPVLDVLNDLTARLTTAGDGLAGRP